MRSQYDGLATIYSLISCHQPDFKDWARCLRSPVLSPSLPAGTPLSSMPPIWRWGNHEIRLQMCKCLPKLSFCMRILFDISFCINNRGSITQFSCQTIGSRHCSDSGLNLDVSFVIYDNMQSLELDPDELDRNSYINCLNRSTSQLWTVSLTLGSKLTLCTKFLEATLRFRLHHRLHKIT